MTRHVLIVSLVLSLPVMGCDEEQQTPTTSASPTTTSTATGAANATEPLATYEALRAQLAEDSTDGLADRASELSKQARAAAAGASGKAKKHLEALADASDALAKEDGDIAAVRKAFGEVSRHLVAWLAAQPNLQKGRHVFECPMAQGYDKWVQTDATKKNPYMGKKMLGCGSETSWDG